MDSLQKLSITSSGALKQWFRKLQCLVPGSFSRAKSNSGAGRLLLYEGGFDEDIFPSQKNLDVIMGTLRKDLVAILRESKNNKTITVILYKLNTLDNNIREACRFQHAWINHPVSGRESLKVQEKYIIRLIEEILDDVFEAYSTLKRRMNHCSFNERSINGVISVLGILKREVSNMINVTIASIEAQSKNSFYSTDSKAIMNEFMNPLNKKHTAASFSYEDSTNILDICKKNGQNRFSPKMPTLLNSKSYPMFSKQNGAIFSSLQNMTSLRTDGSPLQDNINNQFEILHKNIVKKNSDNIKMCSKDKFLNMNSKSGLNIDDITNGCGEPVNNANKPTEANVPLRQSSYKDCVQITPEISKTIESYYTYEENMYNETKLHNKDNVKVISNINDGRCTRSYFRTKPDNESKLNIKESVGVKEQPNGFKKQLYERQSMISWPSATVIRDIKSDNHLESHSKVNYSISSNLSNSHGHNDDISKHYVSSGSDSDESYISCAIDEFELDLDFLNHLKERYIQKPLERLFNRNHSIRDKTDNFSCKSAKMSEIFAQQRSSKNETQRVPHDLDAYHSVESIPCLNFYIDQDIEYLKETGKGVTYADAAISTDRRMPNKFAVSQDDVCDVVFDETFLDSYNTLALSGVNCLRTDGRKSINSMASLTSLNSEIMNNTDGEIDYSCSYHRQLKPANQKEFSPNLEDSQYSSICLGRAACNRRTENKYMEEESKLLAMELHSRASRRKLM